MVFTTFNNQASPVDSGLQTVEFEAPDIVSTNALPIDKNNILLEHSVTTIHPFAKIAYVKGKVVVEHSNGQSDLAVRGANILPDDVLTTGQFGFVSLMIDSSAVLNLQPESRLQLRDYDFFKNNSDAMFTIGGPHTLAAVRG